MRFDTDKVRKNGSEVVLDDVILGVNRTAAIANNFPTATAHPETLFFAPSARLPPLMKNFVPFGRPPSPGVCQNKVYG